MAQTDKQQTQVNAEQARQAVKATERTRAANAQANNRQAAPKPASGARNVAEVLLSIVHGALKAGDVRQSSAIIVNRISEMISMDRAVLVKLGRRPTLVNVSGGGVIEQDSRFAEAVGMLNRRLRDQQKGIVVPDEPEDGGDPPLRRQQAAMRGTQILWLPLPYEANDSGHVVQYALWLERWRGRRWQPAEVQLLDQTALLLAQSLRERKGRLGRTLPKKMMIGFVGLSLLMVLLIPVQTGFVAPAQVVPTKPHYVFAPLEGVLKHLEVKPGQVVSKGDLLFSYDARLLDKKLDEQIQTIAVERAELARLEGAAYADADARAKLPGQRLKVELAESNAEFIRQQRERADVTAPRSGVIVLDDPDSLIGLPLQLGVQVFSIADPDDTHLSLMVPASDAGLLKVDQRVLLRLDRDPLSSIEAKVTRIGFEIQASDDGVPSIRVEAEWADAEGADAEGVHVGPGQRGSAKIYSEPQPLWRQIFRKPLIRIREITGI